MFVVTISHDLKFQETLSARYLHGFLDIASEAGCAPQTLPGPWSLVVGGSTATLVPGGAWTSDVAGSPAMFDSPGYFGSGFCWETHPLGTAHGRKALNDRELSRGGNGNVLSPYYRCPLHIYPLSVCERRSKKPPTTKVSTYSYLRLGLSCYDMESWPCPNSCIDVTSRRVPEGDRMIRA